MQPRPGVKPIGAARDKACVPSFVLAFYKTCERVGRIVAVDKRRAGGRG